MTLKQGMTQAILQATIEATKADIMAVRKANNPVNNAKSLHTVPRSWGPILKQQTLEWKVADKYQQLYNFKIDVKNTFMTNSYNTQEDKRFLVILNWL